MANEGGFWSYAHADDDADGGRIAALARDLITQYEMLTGDSIDLFLDRDSLEWGNVWRDKVDGSLGSVAFFVPVLTPRYFKRTECRRELRTFVTQAERLGLGALVMPLDYVDFPGLHDDPSSDDLIELVKKYHWAPWTDLRFAARDSEEYRRGVAALAQRLVTANAEVTAAVTAAPIVVPDVDEADGSPGRMDLLADMEEAMPEWTRIVERVGEIMVELAARMEQATAEGEAADKRGQGFAGRLTVARRLATDLAGPADEVVRLGSEFTEKLNSVDGGVRAIVEMAPETAAISDDERQGVQDFFATIVGLSESANEGFGAVDEFIEQIQPVARMSRDLRAPLNKFEQGLTVMAEGRQIMQEWVRLISATGLTGE